ncbi:type II toxin-antitoxin system VapC family toxin [Microbacterium sp. STN6]|uniref:type II toxin-antitoxin system VapC family toxin n=1 Tax=Microbacterium sp. STN6 TaxID=2995588 RepID=UPI002260C7DC|nr:type II toxin-antitoxin system VapC family toxin [Microbacterium sp. STN6]MCX7522571.1 type II toxin-antitoxin system VapC family toxin [Microbacterium sp. STN6]
MPTRSSTMSQPTADSPRPYRETVVVDASAMVTLLIDPGDVGDAIGSRLSGATLIAPTHLLLEVTNVLRRQRNAGLLTNDHAEAALGSLSELPIELWPWEPVAARSWQLGSNLSSYDAAYVALAEQTGSVLITRDGRLGRAPGIRCAVELY